MKANFFAPSLSLFQVDKPRFWGTAMNYISLELLRDVPEVYALFFAVDWEHIMQMEIFSAFYHIPWMCMAKYAPM